MKVPSVCPPRSLALVAVLHACANPDGGASGESSTTGGESSGTSSTSSSGPTSTTGEGSTSIDPDSSSGGGGSGEETGGGSGCGRPPLPPGTHTGQSLDVDGTMRSYDLFVPTTYDASTPAPLVLNFHGLYGTPLLQAETSQFDAVAEPRGMLVAYPVGIGSSFNAGACCGAAYDQGVDDVGFARALIEHLSTQMCVDPQRVHATGMSNGGHMAHRLACEAADVFASAASVTGVLGLDPASCSPARPISMLDFHGTGDPIVPYGGAGPGYPPVPEMMAGWAARDGCAATSEVTLQQGAVTCERWPDCEDGVDVTLCTVDGGGHCWPGDPVCLFGTPNTDVVASEMIATMFDAQTLP